MTSTPLYAHRSGIEALHAYLRYMAARPWHDGTPAQNMADAWKELDAHLSAGGTPPEVWREGPDATETDVPADDPAADAMRKAVENLHPGETEEWYRQYLDTIFDFLTGGPDRFATKPVPADDPRSRLEYLRGELRAERISQGELLELQDLASHIDPGDVELLEAAGVPEFPEDDEPPGAWGPTPAQEEGWDAREDYARGGQDAPDWTI